MIWFLIQNFEYLYGLCAEKKGNSLCRAWEIKKYTDTGYNLYLEFFDYTLYYLKMKKIKLILRVKV